MSGEPLILSKKERKQQAQEHRASKEALENFVAKNPNYASNADKLKQYQKLQQRVAETSSLVLGGTAVTAQDKIGFFAIAFLVALLPAYVYKFIYDFDLNENIITYVGVTAVLVFTLGTAYANLYGGTLETSRNADRNVDAAKNWAYFFVNAVFFGLFSFLAFYGLRTLAIPSNYVSSAVVSGVAAWQLSTLYKRRS